MVATNGNAVSEFCFDTGKLSLTFVDNDTWVISYFMKVTLLTYPFFYAEYPFKEDTVRVCIDRVCDIKCQYEYEF